MKNIISLIIFSSIITLTAGSQRIDDSKLSPTLKNLFVKNSPGTSSKWEKEKLIYEVHFNLDGKTTSAL